MITNESGNIEQLLDYYPFGDIRLNEQDGSFDEKRKYTGHEHDNETDLEYILARYYNGNVGRFISADPWEGNLIDPQSLNRYTYSRNNPVIYIDPLGNSFVKLAFGVSKRFLGFVGTALMVKDIFNYGAIQGSSNAEQDMSKSAIQSNDNQGDKTAEVHPNNKPENKPPDDQTKYSQSNDQQDTGTDQSVAAGSAAAAAGTTVNNANNITASINQGAKNYSVYVSYDKAGKVDYVGITNDLKRRAGEWLKQGREIRPIEDLSNLTKNQARGVEQVLIEKYGLKNLKNVINSISTKSKIYEAAKSFGNALLKAIKFVK